MRYSEDLRQKVRKYVAKGGSKTDASKIFGVGRTSVWRWIKNTSPAKKPGKTKPDKIDEDALLKDVKDHPDKILKERAEKFNVTIPAIWVALKRLGIKKNSKI